VVQISEKTSPAPTRKRANRGLFIWSAALFILAVLCVLGPLALSVTAAVPPGARFKLPWAGGFPFLTPN
jgi:hypothetical protein